MFLNICFVLVTSIIEIKSNSRNPLINEQQVEYRHLMIKHVQKVFFNLKKNNILNSIKNK